MKRIASVLTGLSLAVLFFVASAHADDRRIIANIPFEFTVGKVSLPAGDYEFRRAEPLVFQIRDREGRGLLTLVASTDLKWRHEKSRLRFATVDGQPVLQQIWDDVAGVSYNFYVRPAHVELGAHPTIDGTVASGR